MDHRPRLPEVGRAGLTPAQQDAYDEIAAGPRGAVYGPLAVWVNNPGLARQAQALGQYARYDCSLPQVLSELAIIVTARIWSSGFEWAHHAPIAEREGIAPHAVSAISLGQSPEFTDAAQRTVFRFAVELHRDRAVSDATYAAAIDLLGQEKVIDLVAVCGYYTLISMTINAFQVDAGDGPRLPELPFTTDQYFR